MHEAVLSGVEGGDQDENRRVMHRLSRCSAASGRLLILPELILIVVAVMSVHAACSPASEPRPSRVAAFLGPHPRGLLSRVGPRSCRDYYGSPARLNMLSRAESVVHAESLTDSLQQEPATGKQLRKRHNKEMKERKRAAKRGSPPRELAGPEGPPSASAAAAEQKHELNYSHQIPLGAPPAAEVFVEQELPSAAAPTLLPQPRGDSDPNEKAASAAPTGRDSDDGLRNSFLVISSRMRVCVCFATYDTCLLFVFGVCLCL
eukprot:GHVU01078198.1.p1 GENE.GHVU01078198.1~~GHVU01078198.1.p1  ORF type:complete len:261 (-),score=30.46 GHVU01078198.1:141-923(-)